MSVCARAGRAREALDALALMRACGVALDAYTLASALTACRGGPRGDWRGDWRGDDEDVLREGDEGETASEEEDAPAREATPSRNRLS